MAVWSEPRHPIDCICRDCRHADAADADKHEAYVTAVEEGFKW